VTPRRPRPESRSPRPENRSHLPDPDRKIKSYRAKAEQRIIPAMSRIERFGLGPNEVAKRPSGAAAREPGPKGRIAATVFLLALAARSATARAEDVVGTRALGMGDALRAAAVGASGVHLNPSGMTLLRGYVVEGNYGYRGSDGTSIFDGSIVDTLTSRVGAGIFYNSLTAAPRSDYYLPGSLPVGEKLDRSGYRAGLALALPIVEFLHLGLTGKYVSYETKHVAGAAPVLDVGSGFTMDAGATLRIGNLVNLAVVGQNLIDVKTREAPQTVAFGVALTALDSFIVDFDAVFDTSSFQDANGSSATTAKYAVGAELFTSGLAIRGGYLNDRGARYAVGRTALALQYATFGLSAIGKGAALDGGIRQQVSGTGDKETMFNIGLRLFVQ
jgi:hypothetical protein